MYSNGKISLDELLADPVRVRALPRSVRNDLLARCAAVILVLSSADDSPEVRPNAQAVPTPGDPRASDNNLMTVLEVAEILGFARGYTYELVRRGDIRALHHRKYWRISPAAVEEFIRKNEGAGPVDRSLTSMLSRLHDRRTTQASTKGARTRTDRTRETARRASDDNIEVGTRDIAHS
jgi:excisionase family DNA binding protein